MTNGRALSDEEIRAYANKATQAQRIGNVAYWLNTDILNFIATIRDRDKTIRELKEQKRESYADGYHQGRFDEEMAWLHEGKYDKTIAEKNAEIERLRGALERVHAVGYSDDCILCMLKGKIAHQALNE